MTSAVPNAKAGLLAVLSTLPVPVTWTIPTDRPYECAWLGSVEVSEDASIGQVSHREKFVVPVVVEVTQEGDNPQAVETRAWQIVGQIESLVRANPSLQNAAGVTGAWVSGKRQNSYLEAGAHGVVIGVDISITTKI